MAIATMEIIAYMGAQKASLYAYEKGRTTEEVLVEILKRTKREFIRMLKPFSVELDEEDADQKDLILALVEAEVYAYSNTEKTGEYERRKVERALKYLYGASTSKDGDVLVKRKPRVGVTNYTGLSTDE